MRYRSEGIGTRPTIAEILTALTVIAFLVAASLQPYFESQAYNKLTGADTTYWDALWLELRVQDVPRKEKLGETP